MYLVFYCFSTTSTTAALTACLVSNNVSVFIGKYSLFILLTLSDITVATLASRGLNPTVDKEHRSVQLYGRQ